MSACWPLKMPPTQKAVLISLADNANDDGHCWPSISTICERTCFGRTSVIDAIKWLETEGYVTANRENGRHTTYQLYPNQSAKRTGPDRAPVRQADPTSPAGGRDQSVSRTGPVRQADTNRHEPSLTVNEPSLARDARARGTKRCPDGFEVTAELREWAGREVPGVDLRSETAAMRDHTFARALTDWPATWRNWMRNAQKRLPQARASPGRQSAFDRNAEIIASLTGRQSQQSRKDIIDVTPPQPVPPRMGAAHLLPPDRHVRCAENGDDMGAD